MATSVSASVAPVPANQTFAALKSSVLRSVGMADQGAADPLAAQAINNAVRQLNTRNWSWMAGSETVTFVADTDEYTLTTKSFKSPMAFELLNSSSKVNGRMKFMEPHEFMDTYQVREASLNPGVYTVFNFHNDCKITLSSPPNASFVTNHPTGKIRMYKRLLGYKGAADSMTIPSEVELFIEYFARYEVALLVKPSLAVLNERMWRNTELAMMRSDADQITADF
jgi:hypothetical protein